MFRFHRAALFLLAAHIICACSPDLQRQDAGLELSILTLNLHTYQELQTAGADETQLTREQAQQRVERYEPILERIATGITALDPDIICFQEVGEWSDRAQRDPESAQFGATNSNMVHQILARLGKSHYYYTMDWSHFGWKVWMEGSAILSKHPIRHADSRFISNPESGGYESWRSRKVPRAIINVPVIGDIAVYSVHTGWWDDPVEPSREQFQRLAAWLQESDDASLTTILCGDFNAPAAGPAYQFITTDMGFSDQYLLANPGGMFDATIGEDAHGWDGRSTGQRIDYIFLNDGAPLRVTGARRVFTDVDFGRISDHVGVVAEFEIIQGRSPSASKKTAGAR